MSRNGRLAVALLGLALVACACSHAPASPHTHGHGTTTSTQPATTTTGPASTTTSTSQVSTGLGPLVTCQQPDNAYSISLPASWQFANTSVPSDHQTNVWTDPGGSGNTLTVVLSGCSGCVQTSAGPSPQSVVPSGGTVTSTVAPWQVFYTAPSTVTGTTDWGTVIVSHNGSAVTGFDKLDLVLPEGSDAVASQILDSFTLG